MLKTNIKIMTQTMRRKSRVSKKQKKKKSWQELKSAKVSEQRADHRRNRLRLELSATAGYILCAAIFFDFSARQCNQRKVGETPQAIVFAVVVLLKQVCE